MVARVLLIAVAVCLSWQGTATSRSEVDLMEQTLEDITDLREKMLKKMAEASQIHLKLDEKARELREEIHEGRCRFNVVGS